MSMPGFDFFARCNPAQEIAARFPNAEGPIREYKEILAIKDLKLG